jgi:hypothetical protein
VWTWCIWLRIGTSGGLLWTRQWTFGFHRRRGISWLAEWMLASQQGLCSRELVIKVFSKSTNANHRQALQRKQATQIIGTRTVDIRQCRVYTLRPRVWTEWGLVAGSVIRPTWGDLPLYERRAMCGERHCYRLIKSAHSSRLLLQINCTETHVLRVYCGTLMNVLCSPVARCSVICYHGAA